jgi:uncharacterized membrane protein
VTHFHGAATTHAPGPEGPVVFGRGIRVGVGVVLLALLAATVAGIVLLWPVAQDAPPDRLGLGGEQVRGTVTDVRRDTCPGTGGAGAGEGDSAPAEQCATVTVTVDDGPDAGEVVVLTEAQGTSAPRISDGDGLVLARAGDLPLETRYQVVDKQRGPPLAVLAALFAVAVVAVGRWRGLAALVGLGITFALLTLFVLPALLQGRDPLQVAVVGSAAIMFVALYLSHGVSVRTTVALFGTLVSLALTGALAALFVAVGEFSGLVSEEAIFLSATSSEIDLRGLLLAGILIGALGVLDDVTVTQTSAVFELHAANPGLGRARLAAGAMRIGRDHIASTVNTLVLAYAGASLPLLLLFVLAAQPVADTLTNEVVAQEVVRTLVGGLGIVASVPLTTALAVLVAPGARPRPSGAPDESVDRADDEAERAFVPGLGDEPAPVETVPVASRPVEPPVATEPSVAAEPRGTAGPAATAPGGPTAPPARPGPLAPTTAPTTTPRHAQAAPANDALPSRWRRGSRQLRAEWEAADLLRGLRPAEAPPSEESEPDARPGR